VETGRPDPSAHAGPCPPAPDRTAFAHGEFPEWRRAEISRHLLRCRTCREEVAGARDVLGRLAALGASGDAWRDALAAAVALVHAPERTPPPIPVAKADPAVREVAPAAAAPAALAPAVPAALSVDERRLLATQRPDGRWKAGEGEGPVASDEAATGLSLLALAARRPEALREGPIARAVAAATSWLVDRRRAEVPSAVPARDHAISAAALLEVWAATRESTLYPAVDAAVRDLARRAPTATDDADARWAHAALARAKQLGWEHLDAPMRRIPAPARPGAETPWPVATAAAPGDVGTLACALRVLAP
jgi:hypothetical protein